jgi:hypothetical protein
VVGRVRARGSDVEWSTDENVGVCHRDGVGPKRYICSRTWEPKSIIPSAAVVYACHSGHQRAEWSAKALSEG